MAGHLQRAEHRLAHGNLQNQQSSRGIQQKERSMVHRFPKTNNPRGKTQLIHEVQFASLPQHLRSTKNQLLLQTRQELNNQIRRIDSISDSLSWHFRRHKGLLRLHSGVIRRDMHI